VSSFTSVSKFGSVPHFAQTLVAWRAIVHALMKALPPLNALTVSAMAKSTRFHSSPQGNAQEGMNTIVNRFMGLIFSGAKTIEELWERLKGLENTYSRS